MDAELGAEQKGRALSGLLSSTTQRRLCNKKACPPLTAGRRKMEKGKRASASKASDTGREAIQIPSAARRLTSWNRSAGRDLKGHLVQPPLRKQESRKSSVQENKHH